MSKRTSRNRKKVTKVRPFGTNVKISRVLLGLVALAAFKLVLLGGLGVFDAPDESGMALSESPLLAVQNVHAAQEAVAAEGDATSEAVDDTTKEAVEEGAEQALEEETRPPEMDEDSWKLLKRREEELAAKERSLKALESSLEAKVAELERLQMQINQMLEDAQGVKDEKIKHLVDVYSNMKAKQAAAVMETLNQDLAVKILAGMRGRQAGEILSYVEPTKAAKLSEALTRMQVPFGP